MNGIHEKMRGSFLLLSIIASSILVSSEAFAQASSRPFVQCVQKSLTELGFETGVADGIIGKNTLSALEGFRGDRAEAAKLPILSKNSSREWCVFFSEHFSGLRHMIDEAFSGSKNNAEFFVLFNRPVEVSEILSTQNDSSIYSTLFNLVGEKGRDYIPPNGTTVTLVFFLPSEVPDFTKIDIEHQYWRPWATDLPPYRYEYVVKPNTPRKPLLILNSVSAHRKGGRITFSAFINGKKAAMKVIQIGG